MPSPFAGMDPFIQGQIWLNFHNSFCIGLRDQLVPRLLPRYVVDLEERLVVETEGDSAATYVADVSMKERTAGPWAPASPSGATLAVEPSVLTYRRIEPTRTAALRISDRSSRRVVTVVEVLSPWNKASVGYAEYLAKREDLLRADVNLVEIDLVRGGARLPTLERYPPGDHFGFVSRIGEKKRLVAYPWAFRDRLPTLPVPLAAGDAETEIRLQEAFDRLYDAAGYRQLLDYGKPPEPALPPSQKDWVRESLLAAGIVPPAAL